MSSNGDSKYNCVVCGEEISEQERVYEGLDWCQECLYADGQLVPCTPISFVYKRPPYYAKYGNDIPEKQKREILKERGKL